MMHAERWTLAIRTLCALKKSAPQKHDSQKIERYKFLPENASAMERRRARARSRGGEPVEHGAHIVLIGNPDSRGVS